jgi:hypothetical protein
MKSRLPRRRADLSMKKGGRGYFPRPFGAFVLEINAGIFCIIIWFSVTKDDKVLEMFSNNHIGLKIYIICIDLIIL